MAMCVQSNIVHMLNTLIFITYIVTLLANLFYFHCFISLLYYSYTILTTFHLFL